MGADGGGRGEAARRGGDLLSTRRRLRVRGTGTVSGGLAGVPSLALETLGGIFFFFFIGGARKHPRTGPAVFHTDPTAGYHVHVLTQNISVALLTPRNWLSRKKKNNKSGFIWSFREPETITRPGADVRPLKSYFLEPVLC